MDANEQEMIVRYLISLLHALKNHDRGLRREAIGCLREGFATIDIDTVVDKLEEIAQQLRPTTTWVNASEHKKAETYSWQAMDNSQSNLTHYFKGFYQSAHHTGPEAGNISEFNDIIQPLMDNILNLKERVEKLEGDK